MAVQLSVAARTTRITALVTEIGASPVLEFRSGSMPANCAASRTGTVLATMTLPSTPFGTPSSGAVAKSGTWQDASADATGTLGYWTLYQSNGTTVCAQGTVTATGGGGDITVASTSITAAQPFTINTFTITDANA